MNVYELRNYIFLISIYNFLNIYNLIKEFYCKLCLGAFFALNLGD